jgi:anti-anti-sigma factor
MNVEIRSGKGDNGMVLSLKKLQEENEHLHRRVAELEQREITITDYIERHRRTEEELRTFQTLVRHAPDGISIVSLDGILVYGNPAFWEMFGYDDAIEGMHMADFRPPEERTHAPVILRQIAEQGIWKGNQRYLRRDGSTIVVQVSAFMIYDEQGNPQRLMGIHRDLTEQQRVEAELQTLQQQVIDAQQAAIRELSTPLVPIAEGVVVMPLVGSIDSRRAQQVMETLLEGVAAHRATTVVLDITGVAVVDSQVANAFIQAAQAVRLLGARVVLTGIQPPIAHTLVRLGVDLSSIHTFRSVQVGIAAALGRL